MGAKCCASERPPDTTLRWMHSTGAKRRAGRSFLSLSLSLSLSLDLKNPSIPDQAFELASLLAACLYEVVLLGSTLFAAPNLTKSSYLNWVLAQAWILECVHLVPQNGCLNSVLVLTSFGFFLMFIMVHPRPPASSWFFLGALSTPSQFQFIDYKGCKASSLHTNLFHANPIRAVGLGIPD